MLLPLDERAGDQFADENATVQPGVEDDALASFASEQDDAVQQGTTVVPVSPPTLAIEAHTPALAPEADLLRSAPDAPLRLILAPPAGRRYRIAARIAVVAGVVALAAAGVYLYPAKQAPLNGQIAHRTTALDAAEGSIASASSDAADSTNGDDGPAERSLVSGDWMMNTRVESSGLQRYEGLRLGYRVTLRQQGKRISGTGWKVSEDEQPIGATARTSITFDGTLNDDRLELTFTEQGRRRETGGKLVLARHSDSAMHGRFSSTAAESSGVVEIHR